MASSYRKEYEELGGKDAEEHGEGIDGGVAGVRELAALGSHGVGKGEGGRVGVGTADEAHKGVVIDFQDQTAEYANDQRRDNGDNDTIGEPHIMFLNGGGERLAGTETHAGQEEGNAHLAESVDTLSVGEVGGEPVAFDAQPAHEECDDERASGETELHGSFHAHGNGDGAEDDAESYDYENGNKSIDFPCFAFRRGCGLSGLKSGYRRLFFHVYAAEGTEDDARENHAHHGERVGYGIARGEAFGSAVDGEVVDCLLGSREAGSVGDGTGIDASHIGETLVGEFRHKPSNTYT